MGSFKIGDRVNCPKIGVNGTITAIDHFAGRVTVQTDHGQNHTWLSKDLTLISAAATCTCISGVFNYSCPVCNPMPTWASHDDFSEEPHEPKPKACDCGGKRCKTTCATWCSAHESGGTVPYKRPAERLF